MRFEWDVQKAKSNLRKHGVTFDEAATVFYDYAMKLRLDLAHSDDEPRYLALGISDHNRLLLVSHCYRGSDVVRLISARKANKAELKIYQ
nr:BrnT family toxin [uncultured Duganella sp.]